MKLGAENRNKVIAAVSLIVVAVALTAMQFSGVLGGGSSSAAVPAPATLAENISPARPMRTPTQTRSRTPGKKDQNTAQSLDPTLRTDVLKISEETKYEGTGRNIFKVFVEIPPVLKPPVQAVAQNQGPPPPLPPPPINLKFYGFATPTGGAKRIFLAQGEDVFIAKEGDIVDRRYKVVRISNASVEILDVLSNNRQSIPLTQG